MFFLNHKSCSGNQADSPVFLLKRILQAIPSRSSFSLQLFLTCWNQSVTQQNPERRAIGQFEDLSIVDMIVTSLVPHLQRNPPIFTKYRYELKTRPYIYAITFKNPVIGHQFITPYYFKLFSVWT